MRTRVAAIAVGGAAMACGTAGVAEAAPVAVTYSPTGGEQSFVVPGGVRVIHVVATGGKGGVGYPNNNAQGGFGAQVTADLQVTPGAVLYVVVGGGGVSASGSTGAAAAFNGGGAGGGGGPYYGGAGGGGASDVRTVPLAQAGATLSSRVLVAAGGGGGGGAGSASSGTGGAAGKPGVAGGGATAGGAGTSVAGGSAGSGPIPGPFDALPTAGVFGAGGTGGTVGGGGGGGGGGGYYGGGGGAGGNQSTGAGGGGGSSFAAAGAANVAVAADTSGQPKVVVSYEPVATAELSPNGVAFATQTPGSTSASQKVTLANTGTLPLAISGIALGGANPGDFAFDDGCGTAVAPGASCSLFVRFTPAASGARAATLTVSSNAASGAATIALNGTGATTGGGPGPGPGPAPVAPVLSALKLDRTTFRAAASGATIAAKKAKHQVGATITYTLSASATTTFAIEQQRRGVRSGSRCVAPPKHPKKSAKRCTRTVTLATTTVTDPAAGQRSHKLSGRVKGRRLPAGSYILRATPKGPSGPAGAARTVRFRVASS